MNKRSLVFEDAGADEGLPLELDLPEGEAYLYPRAFDGPTSDRLFESVRTETRWTQEKITLYGKVNDVPRLTAWYGDAGKAYTYSGIRVMSMPWTQTLLEIKEKIEALTGIRFNSVLLNFYRHGADSVSWHSDDEPELGPQPIIGSVSFGAVRGFQLKSKRDGGLRRTVNLPHGSLLLMKGDTQANWLHQIPKSKRIVSPRINLTFRVVD